MTSWSSAVTERNPFGDLEIPPELEGSLARHREHLAVLIKSLRLAGVGDEQIEQSVSVIIASYKDELVRTIKQMMN